jgi:hypothetical protein
MSLLKDSLDVLAANVYGSRNVAESLRKSPIELNRDVGPTAILDNDTFKFSSISYPRDVTQDMQNGHYMLFYINVQNKTKYIMNPVDPDSPIGETVLYPKGARGEATQPEFTSYSDTEASYRKGLIGKGAKGTIISDPALGSLRKGRKPIQDTVRPTTSRITDSIAIYLPPNVQDNTTVGYEGVETGVIGMAAAMGAAAMDDFAAQDFAGAVKGLTSSATGLLAQVGTNLAAKAVGGASELLLDVDAETVKGLVHHAFGNATNPYMEVLFQNVGMRTFTYNFTFAPRNEDERDDVQKIIKMFRFHMLPELKGQNERYMTLPSTFDIHYMYQWTDEEAHENDFYNKIATCVLAACNVDYAPGGVRSFKDGSPTQITMSLEFQETEMLTKQHVDKGY